MITTVCLNPAIDQSAEVKQLQIGGTNRLEDLRSQIGGKGINVAIVLKRLLADVQCLYIAGKADAAFFAGGLEQEGIPFHTVSVSGGVRRNLKVIEAVDRKVTELNQQGAKVDDTTLQKMEHLLFEHAKAGDVAALCGSLPPGCGSEIYRDIIQKTARKAVGCGCVG